MFYAEGFYSEAVHGPRLRTIPDPAWVRPRINVLLEPGESFPTAEGEIVNRSDTPLSLTDVPDWRLDPPTLQVPNPECAIPADAVDEAHWSLSYAELMAGQAAGCQIVADANGCPILQPRQPPPAAELRRRAILAELAELDARGARQARALALAAASGGTPDPADLSRLQALEAHAVALREALAGQA